MTRTKQPAGGTTVTLDEARAGVAVFRASLRGGDARQLARSKGGAQLYAKLVRMVQRLEERGGDQ